MPRPFGFEHTELTKARISAARVMHGHRIAPRGSQEYRTWTSWVAIRRRCLSPSDAAFPNYGGRGIQLCSKWFDYLGFLSDMGLRPEGTSLDRIDNDGNYEPSNCRWATRQEQARNRRSNHLLCISGENKTLAEWADISGLPTSTIRMRIKYRGGVVDESILAPVRK